MFPLAKRQVRFLGLLWCRRDDPVTAIAQATIFRGKMIPPRVGAVADIDRRRSTADAVEQQQGEQQYLNGKGGKGLQIHFVGMPGFNRSSYSMYQN